MGEIRVPTTLDYCKEQMREGMYSHCPCEIKKRKMIPCTKTCWTAQQASPGNLSAACPRRRHHNHHQKPPGGSERHQRPSLLIEGTPLLGNPQPLSSLWGEEPRRQTVTHPPQASLPQKPIWERKVAQNSHRKANLKNKSISAEYS